MCRRLARWSGEGRRRSQRHGASWPMEKRGRRIGFSKRLNLAAWVRAFKCNSVYIMRYQSMRIPVSIHTNYSMADKKALVDSGATNNFMHPHFAERMGIGTCKLPNPRKIENIDGTM